MTDYVGIAGVGADSPYLPPADRRVAVFGYRRQTRLRDITDGLSTTLVVVDRGNSGPWIAAGPGTLRGLDPTQPPYLGPGGQFGRPDGTLVLWADGSVRWLGASVEPSLFEALATIHGGEHVPAP